MIDDPLYSSAKFYAIGRNEMNTLSINPTIFAEFYMKVIAEPWEDWPSIKESFLNFCMLTQAVE